MTTTIEVPLEVPMGNSVRSAVGNLFPVRSLNRAIFGRCPVHPNARCDCDDVERPSIASCGKGVSDTGCILVEAAGGGVWCSGQLATCKSAWMCDFCVRRHLRDARAQASFHISAALGAGGGIGHVTFTVRHRRGTRLSDQLEVLRGAFGELRTLKAWKTLGLDGAVRVTEVTFSRVNGWHAHLHVLLFFPAGAPQPELEGQLRAEWNKRLERQGASGGSKSIKARYVSSLDEALYPWKYAPDSGDYYDTGAWVDDPWPDAGTDDSWGVSPWALAGIAATGDREGLGLWQEFYSATKGVPRASYSKGLRDSWKAHVEESGPGSPVERIPVALVASDVWNRAWGKRGVALTESGLRVGRREGVGAMAALWADGLGARVDVGVAEGLPFLYFADEGLS